MADNETGKFELIYLTGDNAGESIILKDGETVIGRSHSCTVIIEDPEVSRQHLKLTVAGDKVTAEDMGSSHGTFLNEKRMRGAISLNPWDVLQLGDTRLRFSSEFKYPDSDNKTLFFDEEDNEQKEPVSGATVFAKAPGGGAETQFASVENAIPDNKADKTRLLGGGETRLMDEAEFKGLKAGIAPPSPRAGRRKKLLAALTILCVVTAAVFVFKREGTADNKTGCKLADGQYALSLAIPAGWSKAGQPDGAIAAFTFQLNRQRRPALIAVYADSNPAYSTTGLQSGFEDYKDVLIQRHDGLKLLAVKLLTVNNAQTVFYAFSSPKNSGKGIFLFTGDKRICVECATPPHEESDNLLKKTFPAILYTFRLTEPQEFIDFPLPDRHMKVRALSAKEELTASALRALDTGEDLLKHAGVRAENLYLARETTATCLTMLTALGEKPEFYQRAALTLLDAERSLDKAIKNQKFMILAAEQRGDLQQAYWESVRLQQIIPDKTSEPYQFAAKRVKKYAESASRK